MNIEEVTIPKQVYEELLEVERKYLILVSNELPAILCGEIARMEETLVLQTLRGVNVQN